MKASPGIKRAPVVSLLLITSASSILVVTASSQTLRLAAVLVASLSLLAALLLAVWAFVTGRRATKQQNLDERRSCDTPPSCPGHAD